jgi:hypothetical protein
VILASGCVYITFIDIKQQVIIPSGHNAMMAQWRFGGSSDQYYENLIINAITGGI